MRQRSRWAVVGALLAAGFLAGPGTVPLYDGVAFPDEPYRFVPPRGQDQRAATVAEARLPVSRGANTGGLLVNSMERGPQVTVYAPPRAFGAAAEVLLRAEPVELQRPSPRGVVESNVYALTLSSASGPVTLQPEAQSPTITLRSVTTTAPLPVVQHREGPGRPWSALTTRRVGNDVFSADAPGAGEYVLARPAAGGGGAGTPALLGLGAALVVAVLLGTRALTRRRE